MREIKFRVWNTETNKMIINVKEMGVFALKSIYSIDEFLVIPTDEKYPLMQYTGLKDKNGVEIYEGDIVKFQHEDFYNHEEECFIENFDEEFGIGQVSWGGTYPAFDITTLENKNVSAHDCEYNIFSCECYAIEVIGNIYENPELLKED